MASLKKDESRRLIVTLILTLFFLVFILFNVTYQAGLFFIILNSVSLLVVFFWDKIPKKHPERKLFSFEKDWVLDFAIGIGIGIVLFLVMNNIPGLSIAAPSLPASAAFPEPLATAGQYTVLAGAAPIVEELAFRTVLFGLLFVVIGMTFFWSAVLSSAAFSLYHINAYAGELAIDPILSISGAFFSAFLVGFLLCYINKWRGSVSTSTGAHGALNTGIVGSTFFVG